jgi:ABC-type uncharacterized transport system permease subunit
VDPFVLSILSLLCFAFGAVVSIAGFRYEAWRKTSALFVAVGLGVLLKTAAIGAGCAGRDTHFFNSASEMWGLLAWALAVSFLVALAVSAARSLGAVVLPLVVALMLLAMFSSQNSTNLGVPAGRLFAMHIVTAFLGYGLFLTACGASVLYLEQARLLKRKLFGVIFRDLPSLERLERLEIICAWLGLAVFSVAIATGAIQAERLNKSFWGEPKFVSALLTWLIFGTLVIGRAVRWLHGRSAAKFVLAGAGLVLVTFALSHPQTFKPVTELQIRNSKSEIRNKFKIQSTNVSNFGHGEFRISNFDLRVCFGFRNSDFEFEQLEEGAA